MDNKLQAAIAVVRALQQQGHIAVLVGGCVRDHILGLVPKDYDVATSALPGQVESIFANTFPLGKGREFGIIGVLESGVPLEVATLRADGSYTDGRRPDSVQFVDSLEKDARRRDFTINAMFFDPLKNQIFDFFGGRRDLQQRIIRSVGDPEARINEDKSRMLRVARFKSRFGFNIDQALAAAISTRASELLTGSRAVAWETVATQLEGILMSAAPRAGLEFLMESGLMAQIIPELVETNSASGDQDPVWHPEGNTWVHTLMVIDRLAGSGASLELMMAALLHDVGKPPTQRRLPGGRITNFGHAEVGAEMAEQITARLKLTNKTHRRVVDLVRLHMRMHLVKEMRPAKLIDLLSREDIHDLIALQDADALGRGLCSVIDLNRDAGLGLGASSGSGCGCENASMKAFLEGKLQELSLEEKGSQRLGAANLVTGATLKELGFTPGPHFRTILEETLTAQREGLFSTLEEATAWVIGQFDVR